MLLVNSPPILGMPIFLNMHPYLNAFWCALVGAHIVYIHCGHYLIPKAISNPQYHEIHHQSSNVNFGSIYLDKLIL